MAKKKKWNEFMSALAGARENEKVKKYVQESLQQDSENFLFLAAGKDIIVRGMHFPDGGLAGEEFPVIFDTSDAGVFIAAWPESEIRKMISEIEIEETENNKDYLAGVWVKNLEKLQDAAVTKIEAGEISRMFF